ncbi:hypothetical protein [Methanocaldococcus sp.]
MWAVVDEKGNIVKTTCNECYRKQYWIFGSKEEAETHLNDEIDILHDIIVENSEEPYEVESALKMKEYLEKCKVKKVKVIFKE